MKRFRGVALGLFCVLALACSRNRDQTIGQAGPPADVVVSIENYNWQDVNVYAERNGGRVRLGTVSTGSSQTFVLPRDFTMTSDFRIRVDPIGASRAFLSPKILVSSGDSVRVNVANVLTQTVVTVR